ncbi:MAG: solute-binding protein [Fusicatenibacter sp.]|nr:solute-binding protein [Fusicatenibacter sp.]
MTRKKSDAGYRAALTGVKGMIRLLIYVCIAFLIILAGKNSYSFGYSVFYQKPVASAAKGQDVTVETRAGMDGREVWELLTDKGLIDESIWVFETQYILSGYHGKLQAGTYILNTSQTVDEMLEILAGVNTEGQPQAEEEE